MITYLKLLGISIVHLLKLNIRDQNRSYRLRALLFYSSISFTVILNHYYTRAIHDYSSTYPPYRELHNDRGFFGLSTDKNNHYYILKRDDGKILFFDTGCNELSPSTFFDQNNNLIYFPATVYWFKLPSGAGWIAELKLNGIEKISYLQGREGIVKAYDRFAKWHKYILMLIGIALLIVLFEFKYQLKIKGEK